MATEKRLIDAEKVYEMGHRTPFHIGIADLCDLKELLADVPTVDAVEVVRCKDCKKAHRTEGMLSCLSCLCRCGRPFVKPDDFCSLGERREGE